MASCPTTQVVIPCMTLWRTSGRQRATIPEWLWVSMNPGQTTRPSASITDSASAPERSPMAAMRSPLIPRSARTAGAPVPSKTCPFLMRRSNFMILPFPGGP